MKKEIIEKEPLDYTAIVYCDGSANPNLKLILKE
jgi:hypothetical protein